MQKQKPSKLIVLTAFVVSVFLLTACGSDPAKNKTEQTPSMTGTEKEQSLPIPSSSERELKPAETETPAVTQAESPAVTEAETPAASSEAADKVIAKINGAADENGIYSIVIKLSDQAADKAVVEMVYYGQKGSPQENSIVNTFRIEYEKEASGTFKIHTFYNGEVYQKQKDKAEVKVVNTFDASLRAGRVIISYTPDGGEPQEIFSADAEQFYAPTK